MKLLVSIAAVYAVTGVRGAEGARDQEIVANRPMRSRQNLVLTVGQTEGDLRGKDDKVIQAGIEYLNRVGGGTLRILPGVYNLRNAIHLRPNITLQGSGERTVLRKASSVVTAPAACNSPAAACRPAVSHPSTVLSPQRSEILAW